MYSHTAGEWVKSAITTGKYQGSQFKGEKKNRGEVLHDIFKGDIAAAYYYKRLARKAAWQPCVLFI